LFDDKYDVVVIGAGHAGIEAAAVVKRMGKKVCLFTFDLDTIGLTPCNPAVGGPGKGHLVFEIDAMGGVMGELVHRSYTQIRVLMTSRGNTARVLRAQIDKKMYQLEARKILEEMGVDVKQDEVVEIVIEKGRVKGVKTALGKLYSCEKVILTAGTYLDAEIVLGFKKWRAGPSNHMASYALTKRLLKHGVEVTRFQTATPMRVDGRTIDFQLMKPLMPDVGITSFKFGKKVDKIRQVPSYLTYTTKETVEVIKQHLSTSPIVIGNIAEAGPRFCPSIDRKVINFPEKPDHQIFVEPEGFNTVEWYLQGLTTSMPPYVQHKILESIPSLKRARITRYGYAIEYNVFPPFKQLKPTLEHINVKGLYFAGQINGTSGYEEAAAQGLIAGINAALSLDGGKELVLSRSSSYIGVLIDDITTKSFTEPYRLYTSRVEYRMILRASTAYFRLTPIAYRLGVVDRKFYEEVERLRKEIQRTVELLKLKKIAPTKKVNEKLKEVGSTALSKKVSLAEILKRPEFNYSLLKRLFPEYVPELSSPDAEFEVETEIKYEAYIKRQLSRVWKREKFEKFEVPEGFDWNLLRGKISAEALDELIRTSPSSGKEIARLARVSEEDLVFLYQFFRDKKFRLRILGMKAEEL